MVTPRPRKNLAPRVALCAGDGAIARTAERSLSARGLPLSRLDLESAGDAAVTAIAYAPDRMPSPARAAELAPLCADAARAGRPVCLLAVADPDPDPRERAVAVAYLRAWGAIVCDDPDVWLETAILVSSRGLPGGPALALVAPPGSWLEASALALAAEWTSLGPRPPALARDAARVGPADVVLTEASTDASIDEPHAPRTGVMVVPVAGRAEAVGDGDRPPLVGLRPAIAAATAAGHLAERLAAGLGPAPEAEDIDPDAERFDRQLGKVGERAGDHETKVLLASYGVPITRQAVATTASAAVRLAKRAGYPVEIKPWGPEVPSERDGCPVERGVTTAAEVRRAFAGVAKAADLPLDAPAIVRATPPDGREVAAFVERVGDLGWTVVLEVPGAPTPACAPAPLRPLDAAALARTLVATRAADPPPAHEALADLLRRASHLAVENADVVVALELSRIVVTDQEALVVDAYTRLRRRD